MKPKIDYSIYLVTDRDLMKAASLRSAVIQAIQGGCTLVQLREKDIDAADFYHLAQRIKQVTDDYDVPLIINDRVDVAMAVDAAGVHVGQSDLPASVVRRLIGRDKILGVSTADMAEAKKAVEDGADYIGVGAVFPTNTKADPTHVTMDQLKEMRAQIPIDIVAIGGISQSNISQLAGTGIDGVSVVSAILAAEDIKGATAELAKSFAALQ